VLAPAYSKGVGGRGFRRTLVNEATQNDFVGAILEDGRGNAEGQRFLSVRARRTYTRLAPDELVLRSVQLGLESRIRAHGREVELELYVGHGSGDGQGRGGGFASLPSGRQRERGRPARGVLAIAIGAERVLLRPAARELLPDLAGGRRPR